MERFANEMAMEVKFRARNLSVPRGASNRKCPAEKIAFPPAEPAAITVAMTTLTPPPPRLKLRLHVGAIFALGLMLAPFAPAQTADKAVPLSNATILIIRHAEKPDTGVGLSNEGGKRAQVYTEYFPGLQIAGKPLKLDHLFAAADSKNSQRPRLTLEPLARALNLPLDVRFEADDWKKLAEDLRSTDYGRQLLICWHHRPIPDLLRELGANPAKLLPNGEWPKDVFNWVIVLRFDAEGRLIPSRSQRIKQHWADAPPTP